MKAAAFAAILALGAAGCASGPRMSPDGKNYTMLDEGTLQSGLRCQLRVCVMNPVGSDFAAKVNALRTATMKKHVARIVRQTEPAPDACDVGVMFPATFSDDFLVYSAYTHDLLARVEVRGDLIGSGLCSTLEEDGDIFRKIPGSEVLARRDARNSPSAFLAASPRAVSRPAAPAPPPPAVASTLDSPAFHASERPDDFAIVIGVENYSELPKAEFAANDAAAMKAYFSALGVPERNLVYLTDSKAGRSAIQKYVEDWLPRLAKPDSRVYFYFSGHGAPDVKTGQAYLMPWDGDANFLNATAYPVKRLYESLAALPAKQVFVAMDSCFSGAGGRSVLASGARPLLTRIDTGGVTGRVTSLTASAATEISGSLESKSHGAFTYFLLEGLNGAATDKAGHVTAKSLYDYLSPRVQDEARRLNRDQNPQLSGTDPGLVLR